MGRHHGDIGRFGSRKPLTVGQPRVRNGPPSVSQSVRSLSHVAAMLAATSHLSDDRGRIRRHGTRSYRAGVTNSVEATAADLFVISGNQAAGKSAVGAALAKRFPVAAHIDGEDVQHFVVSGHRWPQSMEDVDPVTRQVVGEAGRQLRLRLRNGCLIAASFADSGITAILTDIICGRRYEELVELLAGRTIHFVMLRPPVDALRRRESQRGTGVNDFEAHLEAEIDATPRVGLWLDSATRTPEAIADEILARQVEARLVLNTPK
jgi:chloramphenicol 3-O-phosphotransferase